MNRTALNKPLAFRVKPLLRLSSVDAHFYTFYDVRNGGLRIIARKEFWKVAR